MCLICFLEDAYQYKLRKSAQLKTDRFEHSLIEYKLLFIEHFLMNKNSICDNHKTDNNNKIRAAVNTIDIKEIDSFFDRLHHCYLSWINSKPVDAINDIEKLFENYKFLNDEELLPNITFFRGRRSKDFISHWDMFHIPFNKRYLIGNQRYSLVGQPLLYLCTSPYCVTKELNTNDNVKISSFTLKRNLTNEYKLYDNTNLFMNYIDVKYPKEIIKQTDNLIKSKLSDKNIDYYTLFFRLILSSCCSFEINNKQENSYFIEEYILPQLLAQFLKQSNRSGIIYTSTKAFVDNKVQFHYNSFVKFYSNYCLFTEYDQDESYDPTYVYDRKLYNDFNISSPLDWKLNINEEYYNLSNLIKYINDNLLAQESINNFDFELIDDINSSLIIYHEFLDKIYKDTYYIINNGYYDNIINSINLHILFLKNIIVSLHQQNLFKEDFKCLKRN